MEKIFQALVLLHGKQALEREVVIDTTVQEKNITFPTGTKLRVNVMARCWKLAAKENTRLRRSYQRKLKKVLRIIRFSKSARGKKNVAAARRRVRIMANSLFRDITRKMPESSRVVRGQTPERAFCDRGFRGRKKVDGTVTVLPESSSPQAMEHFKRKARKNLGRRSAIETVIGHLKNGFRLPHNYLKGTIGDAVNLLLAAAAFNCRKWMKAVAEGPRIVLFVLWAIMSRRHKPQFETA